MKKKNSTKMQSNMQQSTSNSPVDHNWGGGGEIPIQPNKFDSVKQKMRKWWESGGEKVVGRKWWETVENHGGKQEEKVVGNERKKWWETRGKSGGKRWGAKIRFRVQNRRESIPLTNDVQVFRKFENKKYSGKTE